MSKLQLLEDKILHRDINFDIDSSLNGLYIKFINKVSRKKVIISNEILRIDTDIHKYKIHYENLYKSSNTINKFINNFIDELDKSNLDNKNKLKYLITLRDKTKQSLENIDKRYNQKKEEENLNFKNINKINNEISNISKNELDIENLFNNFKYYQDKTNKLLEIDTDYISLNSILEKEQKQIEFFKKDIENYNTILEKLKNDKNNLVNKFKWSNNVNLLLTNNNNLNKISDINIKISDIKNKMLHIENEKKKPNKYMDTELELNISKIDADINQKSIILSDLSLLKQKIDINSIEYLKINKKYKNILAEKNGLIHINKQNSMVRNKKNLESNDKNTIQNNELDKLIIKHKDTLEILNLELGKLNADYNCLYDKKNIISTDISNINKQEKKILKKKNETITILKLKINQVSNLTDKINLVSTNKTTLNQELLEIQKKLPEKYDINILSKMEKDYLEKKTKYEIFLTKNYSNEMSDSLLNISIELNNYISYLNYLIINLEEEIFGYNDSITKTVVKNDKVIIDCKYEEECSKILDIIMELKLKKKKLLEDDKQITIYLEDLTQKYNILGGISI